MKVHCFGPENAPAILLLPGTFCHWKGNFGKVIPLLEREFRVLCVSYDGFDEMEQTEFPTMLDETEKWRNMCGKTAAGEFARPMAARWAAPSWGCWRHGRTSTWTTAFWAAPIWIRLRR